MEGVGDTEGREGNRTALAADPWANVLRGGQAGGLVGRRGRGARVANPGGESSR